MVVEGGGGKRRLTVVRRGEGSEREEKENSIS